jgi:putative endonuclease
MTKREVLGATKKMYYLYILQCADKSLYTGITVDLTRRLDEHNNSQLGARYTKARRPVKIVYSKKFRSRSAAAKAESRIKKLSRENKLKLIKLKKRLNIDN